MHFPPWILSACLYQIALSFRAIMKILIEGNNFFIFIQQSILEI
jgi:hypothetical protein